MSTKPRTISKAVTGTTTLPASESRRYFFVQAGAGVTATSASTATGNLGTTAYRHSDIVKALKQVGILAL